MATQGTNHDLSHPGSGYSLARTSPADPEYNLSLQCIRSTGLLRARPMDHLKADATLLPTIRVTTCNSSSGTQNHCSQNHCCRLTPLAALTAFALAAILARHKWVCALLSSAKRCRNHCGQVEPEPLVMAPRRFLADDRILEAPADHTVA
jgi:hypothetical protein